MYEVVDWFEGPPCFGDPVPLQIGDINNRGEVVGYFTPCFGDGRAYIWSAEEGFRVLDVPQENGRTRALAINDRGDVVGYSAVPSSPTLFFDHAWLWTAEGVSVDLGVPPDQTQAYALDVNNDGVIVGYGEGGQGPVGRDALRWLPDRTLEVLGGWPDDPRVRTAVAIDERGAIYGWAGESHPRLDGALTFVWRDGTARYVEPPAGSLSADVRRASRRGQLAGMVYYEDDSCGGFPPGCLRFALGGTEHRLVDLGAFPESTACSAWSVNAAGQVLGTCLPSHVPGYDALLWQHGAVVALIDLVAVGSGLIAGLSGVNASSNDTGLIVAEGHAFNGDARVFVLAPLDQPVGDVNIDCSVNWHDLLNVLSNWGACSDCLEDLTGDGEVGVPDLMLVLEHWGR
jgi:probable HAF family extracellular repeat protein